MSFVSNNAGLIGLILFFLIFLGIIIWAFFPNKKEKFELYKNIPFKSYDE